MTAQHQVGSKGYSLRDTVGIMVQNNGGDRLIDLSGEELDWLAQIVGGIRPADQIEAGKPDGPVIKELDMGIFQKFLEALIVRFWVMISKHNIHALPGIHFTEDAADLVKDFFVCQDMIVHVDQVPADHNGIPVKPVYHIDDLPDVRSADICAQMDIAEKGDAAGLMQADIDGVGCASELLRMLVSQSHCQHSRSIGNEGSGRVQHPCGGKDGFQDFPYQQDQEIIDKEAGDESHAHFKFPVPAFVHNGILHDGKDAEGHIQDADDQ